MSQEKIHFNERCIQYRKHQTKERQRIAQLFDPAARARAEKLKYEEDHKNFLASGGYHGKATSDESAVKYSDFVKKGGGGALTKGLVSGKAKTATKKEEEEEIPDSEEEEEDESVDTVSTWEAQARLREVF